MPTTLDSTRTDSIQPNQQTERWVHDQTSCHRGHRNDRLQAVDARCLIPGAGLRGSEKGIHRCGARAERDRRLHHGGRRFRRGIQHLRRVLPRPDRRCPEADSDDTGRLHTGPRDRVHDDHDGRLQDRRDRSAQQGEQHQEGGRAPGLRLRPGLQQAAPRIAPRDRGTRDDALPVRDLLDAGAVRERRRQEQGERAAQSLRGLRGPTSPRRTS